jgi:hypothetical protein
MLDPRNFLRRGFGAGSLTISVQFFAMFGFMFVALPYPAARHGLLPTARRRVAASDGVCRDPALARRASDRGAHGVRVQRFGLALMAIGFLVLSTLEPGSSYGHFLTGLIPFGAGMALAGSPATTAIVASLPRDKQGVASAMNDVSRELGARSASRSSAAS